MRLYTSLLTLVALLFILPTTTAQTIWTGGAGTDAWCDAANWDAGAPTATTDAFVRGSAPVYPEIDGTEACTVEARTLDINDDNSGGRLLVNGGTLDVLSLLYTKNTGGNTGLRLEGGQVTAAGMDLYGDHSGRFTGGELTFDGSNTRIYGTFRPAGTLVRFDGSPQPPGFFFANPGTGAGQSYFEHVVVEGVGLDILSGNGGVNGTAWVTESLTLVSGTLRGGNVHYATTLPVISGGTYAVSRTDFHGTLMLGAGQSYLLPFGSLYLNEDGTAGGRIIVDGGVLDVPGGLYTHADNNGGIALTAGQVAVGQMDLYGDHSGRFTGGELTFDGSNTRIYGTFRPAGTLVRFDGSPQPPGFFFANPGTGAGQSYFEHVVVEGVGLDILSGNGGVNGTAWVTESLTLVSGTLRGNIISGKPRLISPASVGSDPILRLTTPFVVSGLNVNGLEVGGIGRLIFEGGGCIRLDNTTFSVFSATEPRLTIRHPGGELELNNLSFNTTPNNVYLAAEDTSPGNAYPLNLHVVNPTPDTAIEGTSYTEVGGAEVLWDGPALEPLPVTLTLEPADAPPVTVPATGGPLTYRATLTNTSSEPQTFKAKIVAILPSGSVFGPIQGPRTVRIPAGQTIGPVSFTDNVPAIAPPGTYGVVLEGTTVCPEATPTPDGFTFEKESSDTTQVRMPSLAMLRAAWVGDERLDWTVTPSALSEATGDEEADAAASGTVLPNVFTLHTAYPNPFRRAAVLGLDVPTASIVRVEVYDRLGRRVAVLHDGSLEAGTHQLRLEATTLPSGLYVVRATNGRTTFTQRVTIVR